MAEVRCGKCRHYTPMFPDLRAEDEAEEPDEGSIGDCGAIDPEKLPHAWRWAPRERVAVYSLEIIQCPAFVQLTPTIEDCDAMDEVKPYSP